MERKQTPRFCPTLPWITDFLNSAIDHVSDNAYFECKISNYQWDGEQQGKKHEYSTVHMHEFCIAPNDRGTEFICAKDSMVISEECVEEKSVSLEKCLQLGTVAFVGVHCPLPAIPDEPEAQIRSNFFAKLVKQHYRDGDYVVIFDGIGRNLFTLLRIGIPANAIIITERNDTTAIYHKFLAAACGIDFHPVWTAYGQNSRKNKSGFEDVFKKPAILTKQCPSLPSDILNRIAFLYLDTCGRADTLMRTLSVDTVKQLKVLAVNQSHRGSDRLQWVDFPNILCTFEQKEVVCKFYTPALQTSQRGECKFPAKCSAGHGAKDVIDVIEMSDPQKKPQKKHATKRKKACSQSSPLLDLTCMEMTRNRSGEGFLCKRCGEPTKIPHAKDDSKCKRITYELNAARERQHNSQPKKRRVV